MILCWYVLYLLFLYLFLYILHYVLFTLLLYDIHYILLYVLQYILYSNPLQIPYCLIVVFNYFCIVLLGWTFRLQNPSSAVIYCLLFLCCLMQQPNEAFSSFRMAVFWLVQKKQTVILSAFPDCSMYLRIISRPVPRRAGDRRGVCWLPRWRNNRRSSW